MRLRTYRADLLVDEAPPSGVHELSIARLSEVSFSFLGSLDFDFARREQPDTGMRLVADADSSLDCVRVEFAVAAEVLEQSAVRGADGELDVRQLLSGTEKADWVLSQHKGASNSLMILHIY